MKQGLSIIIVNYFSEEYIITLIEKIVSTINLTNYEIIIISNSTSCFKWKDVFLKENNIRIIDNNENLGFSRGINKGVGFSKYNCFCMVNPDININSNTIDNLYVFLKKSDHDVGAISCLIRNSDGTKQNTFFMNRELSKINFTYSHVRNIFPSKIRKYIFRDKSYQLNKFDFSKPFEVGGFYCPFVMMRKDAFLDVGGFDPDFFMYVEDVELFRSRFNKKYKSILYPLVELTHFSKKTDKYGLMDHQIQVSYLLYLRKVGNYYLYTYVLLLTIKYSLLLFYSLFNSGTNKKEALGFFRSLKYLKHILKYPKGYGTLPTCLKIDEIPD